MEYIVVVLNTLYTFTNGVIQLNPNIQFTFCMKAHDQEIFSGWYSQAAN